MPFFSVSKSIEDTPAHLHGTWVGGHEYGTAAAVELLLEGATARPSPDFATLAAARASELMMKAGAEEVADTDAEAAAAAAAAAANAAGAGAEGVKPGATNDPRAARPLPAAGIANL